MLYNDDSNQKAIIDGEYTFHDIDQHAILDIHAIHDSEHAIHS